MEQGQGYYVIEVIPKGRCYERTFQKRSVGKMTLVMCIDKNTKYKVPYSFLVSKRNVFECFDEKTKLQTLCPRTSIGKAELEFIENNYGKIAKLRQDTYFIYSPVQKKKKKIF